MTKEFSAERDVAGTRARDAEPPAARGKAGGAGSAAGLDALAGLHYGDPGAIELVVSGAVDLYSRRGGATGAPAARRRGVLREVAPQVASMAHASWGVDVGTAQVVEDPSLQATGMRGAVADAETIRVAPGQTGAVKLMLEEAAHIVQHRNALAGQSSDDAPREVAQLESEAAGAVAAAMAATRYEVSGHGQTELHQDASADEVPGAAALGRYNTAYRDARQRLDEAKEETHTLVKRVFGAALEHAGDEPEARERVYLRYQLWRGEFEHILAETDREFLVTAQTHYEERQDAEYNAGVEYLEEVLERHRQELGKYGNEHVKPYLLRMLSEFSPEVLARTDATIPDPVLEAGPVDAGRFVVNHFDVIDDYRGNERNSDKKFGVDMRVEFVPAEGIGSARIGFVQVARFTASKGSRTSTSRAEAARTTTAESDGAEGWSLDAPAGDASPIYGQQESGETCESCEFGKSLGDEVVNAAFWDTPKASRMTGESFAMEFVTYAVAIDRSEYLGAVRWGVHCQEDGKVELRLPKATDEQPQGAQLGALKRWNAQSRSRGRDAVKNHPKQVPVPLPSGAGK